MEAQRNQKDGTSETSGTRKTRSGQQTTVPDLGRLTKTATQIDAPVAFEPLLDACEAGSLLKIHEKSVIRRARAGEIPAMRIGRLWRFRASELDAWLRAQVAWICQPTECQETP